MHSILIPPCKYPALNNSKLLYPMETKKKSLIRLMNKFNEKFAASSAEIKKKKKKKFDYGTATLRKI